MTIFPPIALVNSVRFHTVRAIRDVVTILTLPRKKTCQRCVALEHGVMYPIESPTRTILRVAKTEWVCTERTTTPIIKPEVCNFVIVFRQNHWTWELPSEVSPRPPPIQIMTLFWSHMTYKRYIYGEISTEEMRVCLRSAYHDNITYKTCEISNDVLREH